MREPTEDDAFPQLVDDWRNNLGPDKDEGIGLLHKEGGLSSLFGMLRERAPRVTAALAKTLAATAANDYVKGDQLAQFLWALEAPTAKERRQRWNSCELEVPMPWQKALAALDPPMEQRYVRRIEAWVDRAEAIERRCDGVVEAKRLGVGSAVTHPVFGKGVISAVQDANATVTFADGTSKRLRMDKLVAE